MNKLLLSGYYGFDNFGDDLFPYVSSLRFEGMELYILAPKIKGVEGVKFIVPDCMANIYKGKSVLSKILRMFFMVYGALLTRHVVLAGGSVLASDSSNRMRKLQYLLRVMGLCKLSAIGVSVGPFTGEDDVVFYRKFVAKLTNFFVRDQHSYELAKEILRCEPKLYGDIVGALPILPVLKADKVERSLEPIKLGVSLCEHPDVLAVKDNVSLREEENYNELLAGIVGFCSEESSHVVIIVLNGHPSSGDVRISDALYKDLLESQVSVELKEYSSAPETLDLISQLDVYLTVRLHGAIVSFLYEIGFVHLEYHEKCTDFLNHIAYLGPRLGRKLACGQVKNSLKEISSGAVQGRGFVDEKRVAAYMRMSSRNFEEFVL